MSDLILADSDYVEVQGISSDMNRFHVTINTLKHDDFKWEELRKFLQAECLMPVPEIGTEQGHAHYHVIMTTPLESKTVRSKIYTWFKNVHDIPHLKQAKMLCIKTWTRGWNGCAYLFKENMPSIYGKTYDGMPSFERMLQLFKFEQAKKHLELKAKTVKKVSTNPFWLGYAVPKTSREHVEIAFYRLVQRIENGDLKTFFQDKIYLQQRVMYFELFDCYVTSKCFQPKDADLMRMIRSLFHRLIKHFHGVDCHHYVSDRQRCFDMYIRNNYIEPCRVDIPRELDGTNYVEDFMEEL